MIKFKLPLRLFDATKKLYATDKGEYISNGHFVVNGGFIENKSDILPYVRGKRYEMRKITRDMLLKACNIKHDSVFQQFDALDFYINSNEGFAKFFLGRRYNIDDATYISASSIPEQKRFRYRPYALLLDKYYNLFKLANVEVIYGAFNSTVLFPYPTNNNFVPDLFVQRFGTSKFYSNLWEEDLRDIDNTKTTHLSSEHLVSMVNLFKSIKHSDIVLHSDR